MRHRPTQGFSLIALVSGGLLIGAAGLAVLKIGLPYADARVLRGIVENVLQESKNEPGSTNYDVAKKIFDRTNIQTMNLDFDSIRVKTVNPGEFMVHVDQVTKIPLWKRATLVMEHSVDSQTK